MGRIEQGKFYKLRKSGSAATVIKEINPKHKIKKGQIITFKNGDIYKVISEVKFKYTLEDIDNIRVMLEGYDVGTVQNRLSLRAGKVFDSGIPNLRITGEERELLWYIYDENQFLTDWEKETLRKVLNIKE